MFKVILLINLTKQLKNATTQIARLTARIAAFQLLKRDGYFASLRLALHTLNRTLYAVQLRILS